MRPAGSGAGRRWWDSVGWPPCTAGQRGCRGRRGGFFGDEVQTRSGKVGDWEGAPLPAGASHPAAAFTAQNQSRARKQEPTWSSKAFSAISSTAAKYSASRAAPSKSCKMHPGQTKQQLHASGQRARTFSRAVRRALRRHALGTLQPHGTLSGVHTKNTRLDGGRDVDLGLELLHRLDQPDDLQSGGAGIGSAGCGVSVLGPLELLRRPD